MDEFLRDFMSLGWWIGVVAVGLVLNIVGAYAKSPLDRIFSAASSHWSRRSELARAEEEERIALLRDDQEARTLLLAEEFRCRLRLLVMLLLAVFLLLLHLLIRIRVPSSALLATDGVLYLTSIVLYYGSLVGVFFAMHQNFRAMAFRRLLFAANNPPKG